MPDNMINKQDRSITLQLSDADCLNLAKLAGLHDTSIHNLLENFVSDLVNETTTSNHDYGQTLAQQWITSRDTGERQEETLLQHLLSCDYDISDFLVTYDELTYSQIYPKEYLKERSALNEGEKLWFEQEIDDIIEEWSPAQSFDLHQEVENVHRWQQSYEELCPTGERFSVLEVETGGYVVWDNQKNKVATDENGLGEQFQDFVLARLEKARFESTAELDKQHEKNEHSSFFHSPPENVSQQELPVGRIDYLGSNGEIGESVEFTDPTQLKETVTEHVQYGVPFNLTVYRDASGQTIPLDFLRDLDGMPHGVQVEEMPIQSKHLADRLADAQQQAENLNLQNGCQHNEHVRTEPEY